MHFFFPLLLHVKGPQSNGWSFWHLDTWWGFCPKVPLISVNSTANSWGTEMGWGRGMGMGVGGLSWVIGRRPLTQKCQSSGAVWKSRWPSWAFRPNESYGFCGRKATLNREPCFGISQNFSLMCQPTSEDVKLYFIITQTCQLWWPQLLPWASSSRHPSLSCWNELELPVVN